MCVCAVEFDAPRKIGLDRLLLCFCLEVCLFVQTRPAGSKYDSLSVLQSFHRLSSGRPPLLEEFRGGPAGCVVLSLGWALAMDDDRGGP